MAIDCRCGKEQGMKFCVPAADSSAMASEASKNGQRWTKKTIGNFAGKDLWGDSLEGYSVCKSIAAVLALGFLRLPPPPECIHFR